MPMVRQTEEEMFGVRAEEKIGTGGVGIGEAEGRRGIGGSHGRKAEENTKRAGGHIMEESGVGTVDADGTEVGDDRKGDGAGVAGDSGCGGRGK